MKKSAIAALAILSSTALIGSSALAQTASPTTTKQGPVKKAPKVWTDDNIDSVRSPADDYMIQQEQESEQEEAAVTSSAKQPGAQSSGPQGTHPVLVAKTPQEADQMIAQDRQQLKDQQNYINQTQQELQTAPESYQLRLKYRIKQRSAAIARLQTQIADLQKQKDALQAKASAANDATSSNPASAQN